MPSEWRPWLIVFQVSPLSSDRKAPAAGLGGVKPIRVGRRALEVIDLPAREVGAIDLPVLPLPVRSQDERTLPSTDQQPYLAHPRTSQLSSKVSVSLDEVQAAS